MIDEYRIFFVDGMKIMGQISEVTTTVVVVKNPIEIQYEETEYGQIIVVSDPIKESKSVTINIPKSNISLTCDVSEEMVMYYQNIVKKFLEQRSKTKSYLNSLTNLMVEQHILDNVIEQLSMGKVIQVTPNNLN
jgi:hypothetical protein